jgi:hypothetical protein
MSRPTLKPGAARTSAWRVMLVIDHLDDLAGNS